MVRLLKIFSIILAAILGFGTLLGPALRHIKGKDILSRVAQWTAQGAWKSQRHKRESNSDEKLLISWLDFSGKYWSSGMYIYDGSEICFAMVESDQTDYFMIAKDILTDEGIVIYVPLEYTGAELLGQAHFQLFVDDIFLYSKYSVLTREEDWVLALQQSGAEEELRKIQLDRLISTNSIFGDGSERLGVLSRLSDIEGGHGLLNEIKIAEKELQVNINDSEFRAHFSLLGAKIVINHFEDCLDGDRPEGAMYSERPMPIFDFLAKIEEEHGD